MLTCDGQLIQDLEPNDIVRCYKNDKKIKLLKSYKRLYYEIVRDKLNWGGSF